MTESERYGKWVPGSPRRRPDRRTPREPARTMAGAHGYPVQMRDRPWHDDCIMRRGPPASLQPRPAAQFGHAFFNDRARHGTMRASFPRQQPRRHPGHDHARSRSSANLPRRARRRRRLPRPKGAGGGARAGASRQDGHRFHARRPHRADRGLGAETLRSTCSGSWSNGRNAMPRT